MTRTDHEAAVPSNVRHRLSHRTAAASEPIPRWVVVFAMIAGALFVGFVGLHLMGRGLGHHGSSSQTLQGTESNQSEHP
jgi:hypothetical protein